MDVGVAPQRQHHPNGAVFTEGSEKNNILKMNEINILNIYVNIYVCVYLKLQQPVSSPVLICKIHSHHDIFLCVLMTVGVDHNHVAYAVRPAAL